MSNQKENSDLIKVCNDCGRETDADAKFCPFCGEVFATTEDESNKNEGHNKEEKPKQTFPWIMILVSLILFILFVLIIFLQPWKISELFNIK